MRYLVPVLLSGLLAGAAAADNFRPHNSLERQLLAVQAGERDPGSFIDALVEAKIVLLSKQEVLQSHNPGALPVLVLPEGDGGGKMLAVFTSPELAHAMARTYPEYRYGVRTDFLWVLAHTAPGLGVAVNPGWNLGLTIPSYGLLRLRERYRERIQAHLD